MRLEIFLECLAALAGVGWIADGLDIPADLAFPGHKIVEIGLDLVRPLGGIHNQESPYRRHFDTAKRLCVQVGSVLDLREVRLGI